MKEKNPPPWNPPPANIRELQAVLRRIEHPQEMLQMEQNRLDTAAPSIADPIKTAIKSLDSELMATRERIRQHIDNDPDLRQRRRQRRCDRQCPGSHHIHDAGRRSGPGGRRHNVDRV